MEQVGAGGPPTVSVALHVLVKFPFASPAIPDGAGLVTVPEYIVVLRGATAALPGVFAVTYPMLEMLKVEAYVEDHDSVELCP